MVQYIVFTANNKIKVGVVFEEKSGCLLPRWFIRYGRKYNISRVNYIWDERKQGKLVRHFSVTAQGVLYELQYDTFNMVWVLGSVDDES